MRPDRVLCSLAFAACVLPGARASAQVALEPTWIPTFGAPPDPDALTGYVGALAVFDGGGGPELVALGQFPLAGGQRVAGLARWDGEGWAPIGSVAGFTVPKDLLAFDGGGGPALYVADAWLGVSVWDGAAWTALPGFDPLDPLNGPWTLAAFDDGGGAAVYAGGRFDHAGGVPVENVARWDGAAWSNVGGGVADPVHDLAVYDDGSGPALFAAGAAVRRLDGASWTTIGVPQAPVIRGGTVTSLAVHDDGSGPALYAAGDFDAIDGVPAVRVARWRNGSWSAVGGGVSGGLGGPFGGPWVQALAAIDDGAGPALFVAGRFSLAGGSPASCVARWDGASWSALGSGTDGEVLALAQYDDGSGPALFAGGTFEHAIDSGDAWIAKWGLPAIAPIPGCHGNPAVLGAAAKAAKLGAPFPLALEAGAVVSGVALLYGGPGGVDAAGCGPVAPGIGELLLGPVAFPLAPAAIAGGAAAFPVVVPPAAQLAGLTVVLEAAAVGAPAGAPIELSNALAVRILQ